MKTLSKKLFKYYLYAKKINKLYIFFIILNFIAVHYLKIKFKILKNIINNIPLFVNPKKIKN